MYQIDYHVIEVERNQQSGSQSNKVSALLSCNSLLKYINLSGHTSFSVIRERASASHERALARHKRGCLRSLASSQS